MKPDLIPPTANHISTFTHKQWLCALAIMLGLAAVPPSAQGQTFSGSIHSKAERTGQIPLQA